MKEIKKIAKGIGKVTLAVVAGIMFPVLIWVALGAAMTQAKKWEVTQPKVGQTPA